MDSGMFTLHNSISTPDESAERFNALMKFLKLDLSKEELISAANYFYHGFDNSKRLNDILSRQKVMDFDEE
jgi:hypothetical protein